MIKLSVEELHRLDINTYHNIKKRPITVILDNVRSQYNIGAIFRTCDAFRIEKMCLCGICACPPDKEIHKTALGAEISTEWTYHKQTEDAIQLLKNQGYTIWGIEQAHHSTPIETINNKRKPDKIALVFGHEVFGIQEQVLSLCDAIIEIPQYGTKHSLNVSVSAGIVLYVVSSLYNIET